MPAAEELEERIAELRVAARQAVRAGDTKRAAALRRDLKDAEAAWDAELDKQAGEAAAIQGPGQAAAPPADGLGAVGSRGAAGARGTRGSGPLLPLREQVHEALSLLQVPAAPRLIATVHEAFFGTTFPTARLTSLRRDEERSFRTAQFARPYYICAALTAEYLDPSRGLLAISTWPLERRIIGSLSPRVDFLTAAIHVAEALERIPEPVPAARSLLLRFAANIPGAGPPAGQAGDRVDLGRVIRAADAELSVHHDDDADTRRQAARRAREQLDDAQQLFGAGGTFRHRAGRAH